MADFEMICADVGQGDCTLIRLPDGEYMLIDVYRCEGEGIDIFKLLDDVLPDGADGKKRLKYLVVTHAHDDHITGIGDLYDRYEVEWLWVPQHEERKKIAKNFGEFQRVVDEHPEERVKRPQGSRSPQGEKDPDLDVHEDISVRCFSPPGTIEIDESLSEEEAKELVHENCLVLRLSYEGNTSVILTGDSDLSCWKRVVAYYEGRPDSETGTEVLAAEILHASHHGSRTFFKEDDEDSEAWLDALELIGPDAVIVSVGEDNRHGHPHDDMMKAYREEAGEDNVFETCQSGTVVVEVDSGGEYHLVLDPGSYAEDYGWDDDDEEEDGDGDRSGGGGNGPTAAAIAERRRRGSSTRLDNKPAA
jgi:beta-lactamase superfamily II metal-dependent hydrolase